jgi:cell division protein FtsI/penicillin-binding protein 2
MIRQIARRSWRQLSFLLAILLVFGLLGDRLYDLQVNVSKTESATLQQYYNADVYVPQTQAPPRGTIVDAKGLPLVSTVTVYKLAASPPYIEQKRKAAVARVLTDVLFPVRLPGGARAHDPAAIQRAKDTYRRHYQTFLDRLQVDLNYVCLAGDDSPTCVFPDDLTQTTLDTIMKRINDLGVSGISEEARSRPTYPNGSLAAQVLGYVNYVYPANGRPGPPVDTGVYGLQQYYNDLLAGIPGHTTIRYDTKGDPIRVGTGADTPPQPGATLHLTLDGWVQFIVEQDLKQEVQREHATGGTIIVERPADGAILAMASTPSYNPNTWRQLLAKLAKQAGAGTKRFSQAKFDRLVYGLFPNPAISKQYEPGSTFKSVTVATGFDIAAFNEKTTINDQNVLVVNGVPIYNWCRDACPFGGPETPSKMLHFSSNVGAASFGHMIGATTWYDYLLNHFNLNHRTGVDLEGEGLGYVHLPTSTTKPAWEPIDKYEQAFGQAISVTPLQLTQVYAALANGGVMPRPHLLQSYTLAGKTVTPSYSPIQQAVSEQTAARMQKLLVEQAVGGEACQALVPGYDIAAKTGTATIPNDPSHTIASTAAFGPVGEDVDQQFVVLVKIDKPNDTYGSEVAAPLVRDILAHLFQYYKIAPSAHPAQPTHGVCAYVNSSQLKPWP